MAKELEVLQAALIEMRMLRQRNEVLQAQVDTMHLCAGMVAAQPHSIMRQMGAGYPDPLVQLAELVEEKKGQSNGRS